MIAKLSRTVHGFIQSESKQDWLRMRAEWVLFRLQLLREERTNRAFDKRYGTDTAGEMPLNEAGVPGGGDIYGVYRPFWESMFHEAMRILPIDISKYTFVDIGSGKGKLLMLAAHYPFKAIEGVEYGAKLHEAAERNVAIFRTATGAEVPIKPMLGDATTYELPAGPVVCIIFNALDEVTNNIVLRRMAAQAGEGNRPVFVIYANLRSVVEREIGRGGACPAGLSVLYHARKLMVLGNGEAAALWQRQSKESRLARLMGSRT